MTDVTSWSEAAASNNSASPAGFPEGMAPSGLNDTGREVMAAVARLYNRDHPVKTSGGAANVQTLTLDTAPASYIAGQRYAFKAGFTNTAAVTLNVNSLGAKNIFVNSAAGPVACQGGEIIANGIYLVDYDGTQFVLLNPTPAANSVTTGANTFTATQTIQSTDAGAGVGPNLVLDRASASPAAGDSLAVIDFTGRDTAAAVVTYARLSAVILDETDGNEDGKLQLYTAKAGASTLALELLQGIVMAGATGGDKGVGTINATAYHGPNAVKAWVSFNGTGTIAINGSGNAQFNVSSLTDNGTGDYTINFSTALPNTSYAVVAMADATVGSGNGPTPPQLVSKATGSVRVAVNDGSIVALDVASYDLIVVGAAA